MDNPNEYDVVPTPEVIDEVQESDIIRSSRRQTIVIRTGVAALLGLTLSGIAVWEKASNSLGGSKDETPRKEFEKANKTLDELAKINPEEIITSMREIEESLQELDESTSRMENTLEGILVPGDEMKGLEKSAQELEKNTKELAESFKILSDTAEAVEKFDESVQKLDEALKPFDGLDEEIKGLEKDVDELRKTNEMFRKMFEDAWKTPEERWYEQMIP